MKDQGDAAAPLSLVEADEARFAPYGRLVDAPDEVGARAFYSDSLHERPDQAAPVLHTNRVAPVELPLRLTRVERHPLAAQCFLPLDVSRYIVVVMPSDANGAPVPGRALGMIVPGTRGVIYNRGVWHMGASVLDRDGSFAVLMWRGGIRPDDEFRTIPPLLLS